MLSIISLFYTNEVVFSQLKDLTYWILSFSPLALIRTKIRGEVIKDYFKVLMVSSMIGSFIVILLKLSSSTMSYRSSGFISNANLAGSLFALACILSLGIYFNNKSKLAFSSFVVNIMAIFATGSRESLITVIIAIIIIGALL
ncbi:hypothetical protein, partial [Peribacillus simplex]|uniref:hypothetical protein n=1 Tax=Peribacillus simplex TaxID=1478 RepID=UPI001C88CDF6